MEKDFDKWNSVKKELENSQRKLFFKEGEIWWMSVGVNIANESCGKGEIFRRPVLILRKLSGNSFIGIPLSSKEKNGSWFVDVSINNQKRCVLLYQIRMFSTNRFESRLATLDDNDFKKVKEKLEQLLKLT
jgi:mRNA-degrading endonuclease toxin of MazEF toxin-antitoxin module